jgi:phosphohistidine phosphatase
MKIYLIRHGIAAPRGTYIDDRHRPLISSGISKTTKVVERLFALGIRFELILTSPLLRASQTAEILKKAGLSQTIASFAPLKPDGDIKEWLTWLEKYQPQDENMAIALVGHQPDLGNWAEMLIWGTIKGQIVVKKSGVIGLNLPDIGTPISRSTLFLLASPKWIV